MPLNVLIAGQEAAGARILRSLVSSSHRVVAVLTQERRAAGDPASLAALATESGVRVLPAAIVKDPSFAASVRTWEVDLLLNVHSLHIVAADVLAAPRIGSFNLHPGPLPEYAGLHTPAWAVYRGETEYGVTVHWMQPGIDTGPIAFQERFPVPPHATPLALAAECTRRGVALLERLIGCAERDAGTIPCVPQDPSGRAYYPRRRVPQNGQVDWGRDADEVARFARAFDYGPFASPWGRPIATIAGRRVGVLGLEPIADVADAPSGTHRIVNGSLQVACADRWIEVRHLFDGDERIANERIVDWIRSAEQSTARAPETTSLGANI